MNLTGGGDDAQPPQAPDQGERRSRVPAAATSAASAAAATIATSCHLVAIDRPAAKAKISAARTQRELEAAVYRTQN